MVGFSGFFGGGAAEQSLKEDTLGVQEDRLALFREQLQQKASDASMQRKLDEIKAGEQRLAAFDALFKKTGKPAIKAAADRQRVLTRQLRISMGETPEGAQDVSALNQAIAEAGPTVKPGTTAQKIADIESKLGRKLTEAEIGNLGGTTRAPTKPSVAETTAPIIAKVAAGEKITKGELQALDLAARLDPLNIMLRQAIPGSAVPTADGEAPPAAAPAAPSATSAAIPPPEIAAKIPPNWDFVRMEGDEVVLKHRTTGNVRKGRLE
jgi:hypothetical protein